MNSSEIFEKAKKLMPGGVSSPVRAIQPYPFYTKSGNGSTILTVDGEELIDCCCAYGPLLLGHAHPAVRDAIARQLADGWIYGTPSEHEVKLAEQILADHPSLDMIRFVSTGSEATMAAIRLARGFTGKDDIIKLEGGFHGAHDAVLIKAGSGALAMGVPDSSGVIPDLAKHTWQVPYNNAQAVSDLLEKNETVAAFILEPVMGNCGPMLPQEDYLAEVRKITRDHDVLLIFDEVICGYRLGIGGAQVAYSITPDLSTFGKIIGGGLPIGAFGGRRDIMQQVAPSGPVYQAGTFSGNPLSMTAGYTALSLIHEHKELYPTLEERVRVIKESLPGAYHDAFVSKGSMFKLFFRDRAPSTFTEAKESDTAAYGIFWKKMLQKGVFLPPSQYETNFLSVAHTDEDVATIAGAYRECL